MGKHMKQFSPHGSLVIHSSSHQTAWLVSNRVTLTGALNMRSNNNGLFLTSHHVSQSIQDVDTESHMVRVSH